MTDQDPKPTEEDGWPTGWPTAAMRPSDWWFGLYGKRHYESDNCPDPCFDCAALVHYAREILKTHAAAHAAARAEGERAAHMEAYRCDGCGCLPPVPDDGKCGCHGEGLPGMLRYARLALRDAGYEAGTRALRKARPQS